MPRTMRTLVRLSSDNSVHLDRLRTRRSCSRDRLVNQIVSDYLDGLYDELRTCRRKRRHA